MENITWQALMKYPKLIPLMPKDVFDTLNTLNELIPIKFYRSRIDTFLLWYNKGTEAGLINFRDDFKIKHELIHGCGGKYNGKKNNR